MLSKSYPMKMTLAGIFLLITSALTLSFREKNPDHRILSAGSSMERPDLSDKKADFIHSIYSSITASGSQLSQQVFEIAFSGFDKLQAQGKLSQDSILTIIDFSKSSREKRMYVVDLKSGRLLFNSVVAHGRNSGDEYAQHFSNQPNSHKSSLGFYVTGGTYSGSNGYSMILNGMEKGFNDKAKDRAIVMHGAAYANENVLYSGQRLGRSFGCPALPQQLNKQVIEKIKGGNCLFIFYPDQQYLNNSKMING
jgi:hypothetical protein